MCGIAGLICFDSDCGGQLHESLVRTMCELTAHRGPDDSGVMSRSRFALGSQRLSIIDLSPAGHMPMSDASGRWWITYNGEVYNFETVREELLRLGHSFRSRTDTEVILHAYMEWGEDCMDRFVGMFAFAILDAERGEVALVRDRYGIKPLYYARSGSHLLFASEIKALMGLLERPQVDRHSLLEWSLYRNVDALTPETLVEDVRSVLPGHVVRISNGEISSKQYYSQIAHVSEERYRHHQAARLEDVIDDMDAILNEAVKLRLVSDVPVGTLLSGGLDSSLVTSIAAKYTRDLTAFHVSVDGFPNLDERRHAEALTKRFGLPLVPFSLTGEIFRRELPARGLLLGPAAHPSELGRLLPDLQGGARARGDRAALRRGRRRAVRRLQLELPAQAHAPAPAALAAAGAGQGCTTGWRCWSTARPACRSAAIAFGTRLPPTVDLIDRYARFDWTERCVEAYSFVADPRDRAVLGSMLADLSDFLSPLLRRLDRTSMGASVECRVPFLDHRLVHRAINLPLDYKVGRHADKWILKQVATRYFSGQLVTRKKMGFPLPLEQYLEPLADLEFFKDGFCEHTLGLSRRGLAHLVASWRRSVHGFFGLLTLEIWGRLFFMEQSIEEVSEQLESFERRTARATVVTGGP